MNTHDLLSIHGFKTGMIDKTGKEISVGDILELKYSKGVYRIIRSLVKWSPEFGAFIQYNMFETGATSSSINAEHFKDETIVGNIVDNPDEYYPAKRVK